MIGEILNGFRCDKALLTEVERLAKSPVFVDQVVAVGLIGLLWQPASTIVDTIRVLLEKTPIDRAESWAMNLRWLDLAPVFKETTRLADKIRALILNGEEWGSDADEKAEEEALRRRLRALHFVVAAFEKKEAGEGEGLDETIFLPKPRELATTAAA